VSDSFYSSGFSVFSRTDETSDGVKILRADRSACIVCGHPTGDCAPETHEKVEIAFATQTLESFKDIQKILVEETVYENRQITPFTTARVIIAKKGSYVTVERAKELGIIP
jgi:hypothetical protein